MTFSKCNDYWVYQLPEWDNHSTEDIEYILNNIESVEIVKYCMALEKDLWTINYNVCEFVIANDLVYGCEIRASREEDLDTMEKLIKVFNL